MRISDWSSDVCSSDLPPKNGGMSLENHLSRLTFGFKRWPLAVHRLDRDTSGCLLLARHPKAHKRFAAAFEARQVVKGYVAVLEGVPAEQSGMIDLPLYKVSSAEEGWRMVVDQRGKARSEEHTSELQSLMRISYAVFCLKKQIK